MAVQMFMLTIIGGALADGRRRHRRVPDQMVSPSSSLWFTSFAFIYVCRRTMPTCVSGGGRANWNATANQSGAIASVASVSFNFRTTTDVFEDLGL